MWRSAKFQKYMALFWDVNQLSYIAVIHELSWIHMAKDQADRQGFWTSCFMFCFFFQGKLCITGVVTEGLILRIIPRVMIPPL